MRVKPKKHLGQHFLTETVIAERIVNQLTFNNYNKVIEIGPGTGVLTQFLVKKSNIDLKLIEIDKESIAYLFAHYPERHKDIFNLDFLKLDFDTIEKGWKGAIVGNFPYNISSQILFKVLDERNRVPEVVGMFQKEVAERIAAKPGRKTYGIISVLLQAYYDIEYLFTVEPEAFFPPPKVKSGVIILKRNTTTHLDCDEIWFKRIIKATFNQRRKTIRNGLKSIAKNKIESDFYLLGKRAEQLSVAEFVELTNWFLSVQKEGND